MRAFAARYNSSCVAESAPDMALQLDAERQFEVPALAAPCTAHYPGWLTNDLARPNSDREEIETLASLALVW
jgi:hypothetical protein